MRFLASRKKNRRIVWDFRDFEKISGGSFGIFMGFLAFIM